MAIVQLVSHCYYNRFFWQ